MEIEKNKINSVNLRIEKTEKKKEKTELAQFKLNIFDTVDKNYF